MAAQIAENPDGPPTHPDSTLCENCHTWDYFVFISSKSQSQLYYESYAINIPLDAACPSSAICGAVYTAVKTRLDWKQNEGRTYMNEIASSSIANASLPRLVDMLLTVRSL